MLKKISQEKISSATVQKIISKKLVIVRIPKCCRLYVETILSKDVPIVWGCFCTLAVPLFKSSKKIYSCRCFP